MPPTRSRSHPPNKSRNPLPFGDIIARSSGVAGSWKCTGRTSDRTRSASRWHMGMLMWPLIIWGAITVVLVILLIYRSTLAMHEDDQLFLSESESQMQRDQIEIMHKLNKVTPIVKWLGAASGALILLIGGMALYQQISQMQ